MFVLCHLFRLSRSYWWIVLCCVFFFFKQKTAYEMRISDWSSGVCSSDLTAIPNIAFVERTGAVLDEPFFLMDRAEGRVPTDFPGFHGEGWVFDLPEEDRTSLWWNGIKAMEKLHRIGWEKFPFLAKGTKERQCSRFYMPHLMQTRLDWAAQDRKSPRL